MPEANDPSAPMTAGEWSAMANACRMAATNPNLDDETREEMVFLANKATYRRNELSHGRVVP